MRAAPKAFETATVLRNCLQPASFLCGPDSEVILRSVWFITVLFALFFFGLSLSNYCFTLFFRLGFFDQPPLSFLLLLFLTGQFFSSLLALVHPGTLCQCFLPLFLFTGIIS